MSNLIPASLSQDVADSRYVNVTGDTMTGALSITLATGNSLIVDTSGLVYDATNDRVGIGIASPVTSLHVINNDDLVAYNNPHGTSTISAQTLEVTITDTSTATIRFNNIDGFINLGSNPSSAKVIYGFYSNHLVPSTNTTTLSNLDLRAMGFLSGTLGSGGLKNMYGALGYVTGSGSGAITNAIGSLFGVLNPGTHTVTNAITFYIDNMTNGGTITNTYGLFIGDLTVGTQINQAFSIYASDVGTRSYIGGDLGIGVTAPTAKLDIDRVNTSSNSELLLLRVNPMTQTITGAVTNARFNQFLASTITAATAQTVTTAATVYIDGATVSAGAGPAAITNNYSLFVDGGLVRFDGDGTDVFELPADATDPTGGGGAAAGRIPIKVGGSTRYLAYY